MSSINRDNGYMLIDHRDSPGIPEAHLHALGIPQSAARGVYEVATVHCKHCGGHYRKRADFDGTRVYCKTCNHYVCNPCARRMVQADYVHRTFEELANLVQSGQFTLAGSSSNPILIPIGVT